VPSFHEFAAEWWTLHEHEWSENTRANYRWRLEEHLLGHFEKVPLDEIDFAAVEGYIAEKRCEGLSPRSINATLKLMASILEVALERELIPRNPARGRKRRIREQRPARTYIDSADGIAALLAAAKSQEVLIKRRTILTVLTFTGLRIGEVCKLRWRHVDLPGGWLSVGEAKTDAGVRRVRLRPIVREELASIRPENADPHAFVFATARGSAPIGENIRTRVLAPAAQKASAELTGRGLPPLPELTPHSLRRTFASVLYAIGESPTVVMTEMGHTTPNLALSIYAQTMQRTEEQSARLRSLVEGVWADDWADEPANAPDLAS
jgi:integrase